MSSNLSDMSDLTRFHLARAEAIDAYASLEHALLMLFSNAINTRPDHAAIVFTRMVNTRSRNEIISELINSKFGDEAKKFTKSLIKQVQKVDSIRNKIVHWSITYKGSGSSIPINPPPEMLKNPFLSHPNLHKMDGDELYINDLIDFIAHVNFLCGVIETLAWSIQIETLGKIKGMETFFEKDKTPLSREIFLQQVDYPPPSDSLLYRFYRAPSHPPEPSQE